MIESVSNANVKFVEGLNTKSKNRKKENAFVVEGPRMVFETPVELLQKVFVTEDFSKDDSVAEHLQTFINKGIFVETVADKVMKAMSDTVTPQGILAVVKKPEYELKDLLSDCPLILMLETIQDPGNLGTMFRTAEGAGCTGVILSKDTVDLFLPKVVRSTMGSLYRMPFVIREDLDATILELKQKGVRFYAAHLGGTHTYDDCDYTSPTAFLIGNEGNGLSAKIAEEADEKILIPMGGELESLNAAMASGILMYEASRQRRRGGK